MIEVKTKHKGLYLPMLAVYGSIGAGIGCILLVGLLSGLVARPNNCVPFIQIQTLSTNPTSVSIDPFTSSSTSSSSTSRTSSSTSISKTTASTSSTSKSSTVTQVSSSSTTKSSSSSSISTSTVGITSSPVRPTPSLPSLSSLATTNPSISTSQPARIRLPKDAKPIHYDLFLNTYFEPYSNRLDIDSSKEWFEGRVKITIDILNKTDNLIFHSDRSLNITRVELKNENNELINIKNRTPLPNQLNSLNLEKQLVLGKYFLSLDFTGNYGPLSNLYGFYRTKYREGDLYKTVLGTKFEPIDARKAFPCFDEPEFKASYVVTIEHPDNSIALSNWPEKTVLTKNGRKVTTFDETFPMSTYLIAWVVAPDDFKYVEKETQSGKKVRVYARKSAVENSLVDYAVIVARDVINYFEQEYFAISDAVPPKIDLVGLSDFSAGAMEHWGLVGFRETYLFFSESQNSVADGQSVAAIIAHELAHFWFGNLVTCKWWNDLWLNEAMATFLQYKAIEAIYPEMKMQDQFLSDTLVPVMYDDGYESSHPVSVDVTNPDQISSLFSSITYDKGSSLLFMLESTVGEINFRDGLRNYLRTNKFGSGVAADFYRTLELPKEMQGKTTAQEYIETWLLQINYPEVFVNVDNRNSQKTKVDFIQDRFLLSVYDESFVQNIQSPYNYVWKIYLQCKAGKLNTKETTEFTYYLDQKQGSLNMDKSYDWIKCNKDFKGFYVTNYDKNNYLNLIEVLRKSPEIFSIGDRANLLHISYSLAFQGSFSYELPAYLTSYIQSSEQELVPWRIFIWHIKKLSQILEHRPIFNEIRKFSLSITKPFSDQLNLWDDTGSESMRLLKAALIEFLCRLQDSACLKKITQYYLTIPDEYFFSPIQNLKNNTVEPNFRGSVYKYHIQNTYEYEDWFKMNELYLNTIDPTERAIVVQSLGHSRLSWILDLYLDELMKDNTSIRPQDFFDVVTYIGRNPSGRHIAWTFLRENWFEIIIKFGASRGFYRALKNVCESFDNKFLLEEVLKFFEQAPAGQGQTMREQTIEIIANNIFWVTGREQDLYEAFYTP